MLIKTNWAIYIPFFILLSDTRFITLAPHVLLGQFIMSLIAKIGRTTIKVRILIWSLYLFLVVGAATMVYPFLLMLAGSMKSGVDQHESQIIPSFLTSEAALIRKYAEGFFNESLNMARILTGTSFSSFRDYPVTPVNGKWLETWQTFLEAQHTEWPEWYSELSFMYTPVSRGVLPENLQRFKRVLSQHHPSIQSLNQVMHTDYPTWNSFFIIPRNALARNENPESSPIATAYNAFKRSCAASEKYYFCVKGYFSQMYLRAQYARNIDLFNEVHETDFASFSEVLPPSNYAECPAFLQEDWAFFVRNILNIYFISASKKALPSYHSFLEDKYGDIDTLNELYTSDYRSFSTIPLPDTKQLSGGLALSDWDQFIHGWTHPVSMKWHGIQLEHLMLRAPDYDFTTWLQSRWGTISNMNTALSTSFKNWNEVIPPQREAIQHRVEMQHKSIRWMFIRRNYGSVSDYILLHGKALKNTMIYCGLAILLSLIVNPLAAYALSRFKPPSTYIWLLCMMMTMSFPPMVTQIPSFLMLRNFNLLNTFWALILPGMANGFSIFLLKGFFDSLPQDLYDAAAIDGADECRIFWNITMSLSQPILAVIALNAFTLAYSNFMMALLICQDQNMWTIMPWLYQLQQNSGPGIVFASLIISAVPTFLVFVFCQNIIMRGIVVPVEK